MALELEQGSRDRKDGNDIAVSAADRGAAVDPGVKKDGRSAPGPASYDALTGDKEQQGGAHADPQVAAAHKDQPLTNFEAVVEQLAHGFVSRELSERDEAFMKTNGYKAGPIINGKHDFVMRSFLPVQQGKQPIVAFRGTVPSKVNTLITDIDPSGIGMYQFNPNKEVIHGQMENAASHGPVISSGHSLGGALAQIAACTWPGLVGRIITFQAPGINKSMADGLKKYNQDNPDKAIGSTHHRVDGDLVPYGGEALTQGTIHTHKMKGGNPLSKHTSLPLAQEERARGNELPVQDAEQEVSPDRSFSTEDDEKPQWIEAARRGIGGAAFGIGGAAQKVGEGISNIGQGIRNGFGRLRDKIMR